MVTVMQRPSPLRQAVLDAIAAEPGITMPELRTRIRESRAVRDPQLFTLLQQLPLRRIIMRAGTHHSYRYFIPEQGGSR